MSKTMFELRLEDSTLEELEYTEKLLSERIDKGWARLDKAEEAIAGQRRLVLEDSERLKATQSALAERSHGR